MKKLILILLCALLVPGMVTAAGAQEEPVDEPFKAAFIYIGSPVDYGWTYEHDVARQAVEEEFGDEVETAFMENVSEGDVARVLNQFAQQGYQIVFGNSFGYMDFMAEAAEEFPNVYFEHCSGYREGPNKANYFGRIYQARYLSGLVAGAMTETNRIGYVAAHPIPEVIRGINSFTLGVREANPDAEVQVVWTNTWFDPAIEREAAESLLDAGADVIAQHQDTTEPQRAAQDRGMYSIGYHSDMRSFVGDSVLSSAVWDFSSYYIDRVKAAMEGTWESGSYWGSLADGIVGLADFSPLVSDDVIAMVESEKERIVSGEWDVFHGPVYNQDGEEVLAAGEEMSDGDMLGMSYFVEGVVGRIE